MGKQRKKFILERYPLLPWRGNWSLRPSVFVAKDLPSDTDLLDEGGFKTVSGKPVVRPANSDLSWGLSFSLPGKIKASYFSDRLKIQSRGLIKKSSLDLITPRGGVLCGRVDHSGDVSLAGDNVEEVENESWLETGNRTVFLLKEERESELCFCLVVVAEKKERASEIAHKWVPYCGGEIFDRIYRYQDGIESLIASGAGSEILATFASESLAARLMRPEGVLTGVWSCSSLFDERTFYINELYSLVSAWRHLDSDLALELLKTVFATQREDGHISAWIKPDGSRSLNQAPWPLIAQSCKLALEDGNFEDEIKYFLPRLTRYMRWMLRHFTSQRDELPCHRYPEEMFQPEEFDAHLSTAGLVALLLCELRAVEDIYQMRGLESPAFLQKAYARLEKLLYNRYWDAKGKNFSRVYLDAEEQKLAGFHSYLPLLWSQLDGEVRSPLMGKFFSSTWFAASGNQGVEGGDSSAESDRGYPIIYDLVKLHACKKSGQRARHFLQFVERSYRVISSWFDMIGRVKSGKIDFPGLGNQLAGYAVEIQSEWRRIAGMRRGFVKFLSYLRYQMKTNRDELVIAVFTIFMILVAKIFYYSASPEVEADQLVQSVTDAYQYRQWSSVERLTEEIIELEPDNLEARRMLANSVLLRGHPERALPFYRWLYERDPNLPASILGQAICLHRGYDFESARPFYREFVSYFSGVFPAEAKLVKRIMEEEKNFLSVFYLQRLFRSGVMDAI